MADFVKFQDFVEQVGLEEHNLNTDTLKVYLSNEAPLATDTVKTDIAEITIQNGYTGPLDIENSYTESGGTGTCTGVDKEWNASGGSFGPFRYVILYNDTNASDRLIAWWDYGSSISCNNGEKFTVDIITNLFTLA